MNQEELNQKLIEHAKEGKLDLVKFLVEKGTDIHVQDVYSLKYASCFGYLELVQYLVEQGADIHTENNCALRWATENNHLDVVKYLVEKGADIHVLDDYPLNYASSQGNLEMVKFLVEKGANIYTDNDEALKMASNHLEVLKYFLFDCQMKIKQETKDWLIGNKQYQTLQLIEKRDLLFKLNQEIIQKDSFDNLGKKSKI